MRRSCELKTKRVSTETIQTTTTTPPRVVGTTIGAGAVLSLPPVHQQHSAAAFLTTTSSTEQQQADAAVLHLPQQATVAARGSTSSSVLELKIPNLMNTSACGLESASVLSSCRRSSVPDLDSCYENFRASLSTSGGEQVGGGWNNRNRDREQEVREETRASILLENYDKQIVASPSALLGIGRIAAGCSFFPRRQPSNGRISVASAHRVARSARTHDETAPRPVQTEGQGGSLQQPQMITTQEHANANADPDAEDSDGRRTTVSQVSAEHDGDEGDDAEDDDPKNGGIRHRKPTSPRRSEDETTGATQYEDQPPTQQLRNVVKRLRRVYQFLYGENKLMLNTTSTTSDAQSRDGGSSSSSRDTTSRPPRGGGGGELRTLFFQDIGMKRWKNERKRIALDFEYRRSSLSFISGRNYTGRKLWRSSSSRGRGRKILFPRQRQSRRSTTDCNSSTYNSRNSRGMLGKINRYRSWSSTDSITSSVQGTAGTKRASSCLSLGSDLPNYVVHNSRRSRSTSDDGGGGYHGPHSYNSTCKNRFLCSYVETLEDELFEKEKQLREKTELLEAMTTRLAAEEESRQRRICNTSRETRNSKSHFREGATTEGQNDNEGTFYPKILKRSQPSLTSDASTRFPSVTTIGSGSSSLLRLPSIIGGGMNKATSTVAPVLASSSASTSTRMNKPSKSVSFDDETLREQACRNTASPRGTTADCATSGGGGGSVKNKKPARIVVIP
ncbi:unnamed protein product [Amoebophrya sp. A120]|nr:unnamed protein product [Amoebophrya sp. A120]|eukprot:GSA120T00013628001.1